MPQEWWYEYFCQRRFLLMRTQENGNIQVYSVTFMDIELN